MIRPESADLQRAAAWADLNAKLVKIITFIDDRAPTPEELRQWLSVEVSIDAATGARVERYTWRRVFPLLVAEWEPNDGSFLMRYSAIGPG